MTTELTTVSSIYTDELKGLMNRAQKGDYAAQTELRALLDQRSDLWQTVGDLSKHAELNILRLAAGDDYLTQEAMRRMLAQMKADLAGPSPSLVEKMLVERVGVCWLHVNYLEIESTRGLGKTNTPQAVYVQRRLDSANRRYLTALRQLVTVRRLLSPDFSLGSGGPRKSRSRRVEESTPANELQ